MLRWFRWGLVMFSVGAIAIGGDHSCCAQAPGTGPHPAITLVKGKEFAPKGNFIVGYRFAVQSRITVTELGVFDREGDGIVKGTSPVKIGLWDANGQQLASAEVPLGTKPRDGAFYVPIKPLDLTPGSYVVAYASPEEGERYWFSADITMAPEIKWEAGLYCGGKDLVLPGSVAPGTCYFGPTMMIATAGSGASVPAKPAAAQVSIAQPVDRAVYQRNAQNVADIPVAWSLSGAIDKIEIRVIDLKTTKAIDKPPFRVVSKASGAYTGVLSLPAGWYRLELQAMNAGKPVASAVVDHVGVGEVFLTCGQSNSCNHGQPHQSPQDERVNACDWQTGQWRQANDPQPGAEGDGGSPWPILGDLLAKQYDVPVGFISVGVGATAVEQWLPGGDLCRRIKVGLNRAGPHGVRAVLWHQGESDSLAGTPTDEYARMLGLIIARSRRDAGYDVPWGVALASYHPSSPSSPQTQAQVIAAQKLVIEKEHNVFTGPSTDGFHLKDYMADGVHFNAKGLAAHAAGWAEALKPLLETRKP